MNKLFLLKCSWTDGKFVKCCSEECSRCCESTYCKCKLLLNPFKWKVGRIMFCILLYFAALHSHALIWHFRFTSAFCQRPVWSSFMTLQHLKLLFLPLHKGFVLSLKNFEDYLRFLIPPSLKFHWDGEIRSNNMSCIWFEASMAMVYSGFLGQSLISMWSWCPMFQRLSLSPSLEVHVNICSCAIHRWELSCVPAWTVCRIMG
jgi:hypothetical protein